MSGLNKSDPATHRIYNKEGVTHVNQVPAPRSGEERLGIANRNESGPGHPEQTRPFYQPSPVQVQLFTPVNQNDTN
uniref:Uncharacterized protein n=1 Tax=Physcomitrium patens TaxID=3218 RepID=A0A2K1K7H3_PHYPA|nr:hypothetical protein PHYPA_011625 [Physcomitrium patens]